MFIYCHQARMYKRTTSESRLYYAFLTEFSFFLSTGGKDVLMVPKSFSHYKQEWWNRLKLSKLSFAKKKCLHYGYELVLETYMSPIDCFYLIRYIYACMLSKQCLFGTITIEMTPLRKPLTNTVLWRTVRAEFTRM